jgi:hypothetical protein
MYPPPTETELYPSPRPSALQINIGPSLGQLFIKPVSADLLERSDPWKQGHSNVFCAVALKPERAVKKQMARKKFNILPLILFNK